LIGNGGSISVHSNYESTTLNISKCLFDGCESVNGGGVSIRGKNIIKYFEFILYVIGSKNSNISDCIFMNNEATDRGGGIINYLCFIYYICFF
jgi:hypothetical protein